MDIEEMIKKWDEQIALHRRVCDDPLMYTKEDRLKNSHYAQAICAVVADLKKLTIPAVVGSPIQLEPVLAEIEHINDLGKSTWYEVVYYDDKWYSYSGSKTFEDGEQVVKWKYAKDSI